VNATDSSQRGLPAGTVTLLFADVEGSTRLLHLLGERFAPARARMRELVRAAAAQHHGAEVDWAGDGVFLSFSRARDAIAAAVEIQRSLAAEPWPDEEAHRLRIGVHTGEPELGDEGYVGMDVVIAARVCGSAHGEQIVVTRAARDMAGAEPLPGASFRPLGHHRLKDVPATPQLFQLVAPDLRDDFPPLKTLTAASLPALHHRLVGRADSLARAEALLEAGVRLVTITGPGGAGKSRLALEVAARAALQRPVHLVGLAPVLDGELIPSAIAHAIGARESSGRPLLEPIADRLNGSGALLFLDNLEHLEPAAAHVAELIDRVPDLQVLATSRTPLRLSAEHVLPLEPLSIDDATTLFVELAAARGVILRDDALVSVQEICRRLDGLPLAIELVAARLAVLPPAEILRALGEGLALEMEGPVDLPERQRTLRAAIDWSYTRLTDTQRELHAALAVFAESGALNDVRAVADAGAEFLRDLEALVGWSLIRSDSTDGELRLSMLQTVREHALERAASEGTLEELRRRHAERFLDFARAAEGALAGPEQGRWLERLEREIDNIRATLEWSLSTTRVEDALRALAALGRFWRAHGHVSEARRWLSLGLASAEDVASDVRADALWAAARQATAQMDVDAAVPLLEDAVVIYRELKRSREAAFALSELAWIVLDRGEVQRAEALCDEALAVADEAGDARARSGALRILADVVAERNDITRAIDLQEEALALRRTLGDPLLVSDATYHLGVALFRSGDHARARHALEESLTIARSLGEGSQRAAALFMLAVLDLLAGDTERAEHQVLESLDVYTQVENDRDRAECLVVLAGVATAKGSFESAGRLLGAADALRGGAPLDLYELPVLERFQPDLEAALGEDHLARLLQEGSNMDPGAVAREVVIAGSEE
jgi:predicted ATPase/class 3 adenylate cyclase